MTVAVWETARRSYFFSCSHENAEGIFGHNYCLEVVYVPSGEMADRSAESRIQKELVDRIHSRDLSADRALFGATVLLDDHLIARTLAVKARDLALPTIVLSAILRRTDTEAIEIVF